jgi:acyl-CoA dehydrogenase
MEFALSDRVRELQAAAMELIDEHVIPAERRHEEEIAASGDPHQQHTAVVDELQREARARGLWNLFLPDPEWGAGLSNLEYAPIAEILGRSIELGPLAANCAAPDTGNMEILAQFGTPEQQREWLVPLLAGETRSCFAMTEPDVASSDAESIASTITRDGDELVLRGRKWWITGAARPRCRVAIYLGLSEPDGPRHRRHSMVLVPMDAPGLRVVRSLSVFGYDEAIGHAEMVFEDVRVPAANLLGEPGGGFAMAQARLGPGRIHHCMRAIGQAERALELMARRALSRTSRGRPLAEQGVVQEWIAESRIELEAARLLVLKTAWLMDTAGNREAATEISAIKVLVPTVVQRVFDRAVQVHGAAGVSQDLPLAFGWAFNRTLRIADGPDEVHKAAIARRELRRYGPR